MPLDATSVPFPLLQSILDISEWQSLVTCPASRGAWRAMPAQQSIKIKHQTLLQKWPQATLFLCKGWILSFTLSTLTTSTPSAQGSWKLLARTPLDGLPAEAPHSESACLLHWSLLVLWLVARNGEKASKKNWRSCDQIIRWSIQALNSLKLSGWTILFHKVHPDLRSFWGRIPLLNYLNYLLQHHVLSL